MKRKLLAALLAGSMVLSMAACGNNDSGSSSPASESGSAESSSGSSSAENSSEAETPESDEVIEVTMMVATKSGQGDWNDYWLMDKIEETCGIRFKVDQIIKDAWAEKESLAFATGDLPMVFLNDLTDTELATYGAQGLLLPLEDYISKETMPNLYAAMENDNVDLLAGIEVRVNCNFLNQREELSSLAKKIIYTGPIDEYYKYCFGPLEYRSIRFETEVLNSNNYQGNAVVNYTAADVPYTRIIEHKHFEFGTQEKTVISKEYSSTWNLGEDPYYPVNDNHNNALYRKYKALSLKDKNLFFGGRLGFYKYMDMDDIIESALEFVRGE